ncbi:sugar porter family MFS transporter [Maribellus maritimus]|nr:sugar porter family MFS transporter [Maribellus maritimus]
MKKKFVIFVALVASLGGFLFGFDTAVISGAEKSIQKLFVLSDWWHGFTVAAALIGTIIGALSAGKPADRFGRKKVLIITGVLYAVGALGSALTSNWYVFMIFRFLGGLGVGASSVAAPMYIAESSPSNMRGRLVAFFQLNVVTGILVAFLSNYLLSGIGENAWRWMLGIQALPATLFVSLVLFIPNSPRWLIKINQIKKAEDVFRKLGVENPQEEVKQVNSSILLEKKLGNEILLKKVYTFPILCAFLIAFFNQASGINAIMYYSPRIFEMTGISKDSALLQSVAIGLTNLIFTVLAIFIIDKFGRRLLMLIGSVGLITFLTLIAITFYTQNFNGYSIMFYLIGYIAFFAFSQGAVIWVFISEIFPTKVRAKGQTLGSFTHWLFAALISWLFPMVAEKGNTVEVLVDGRTTTFNAGSGHPFLFFAIMMFLQLILVWKYMPETKGKSLEELERMVTK